MGSGNAKNKVKPESKNQKEANFQQKLTINSIHQNQEKKCKQFNIILLQTNQFFIQTGQQAQDNNKENSHSHFVNELKNQISEKIAPIKQVTLQKQSTHKSRRLNNVEQLDIKNIKASKNGLIQFGSDQLDNKFDQESITKEVKKSKQIKENLIEDQEFKQAISLQSYNNDGVIDTSNDKNKIQSNSDNKQLKTLHHIGNKQLISSNLFKSTRKIKSNIQFKEEKQGSSEKKKIILKSMKNFRKPSTNSSDTSSYQSSAYSRDNSKNNKQYDESPMQKTSSMNTPLSLQKIKLNKGGQSPFKRDQIKKFSQKTVKDLLDQNIFKYQLNGSKLNFEINTEECICMNQQNQQKSSQDNWMQGSISKISSVMNSEQVIRDSNHRLNINNVSNKQYKDGSKIESQDLQSINGIDDRQTTLTTNKGYPYSNELYSSNLKTKQELDHPHTSESTFKKAYISRDANKKTSIKSITSLKDVGKTGKSLKNVDNEILVDEDIQDFKVESQQIRKSSQNNLRQSIRSQLAQNSLQERENEEGSLEDQFQPLGNVEDDDDEYIEDDDYHFNLQNLKNHQKQEKDEESSDDNESDKEYLYNQELNDSLLTTYDFGCIDALHVQQSQPQEDDDNDLSEGLVQGQIRRFRKKNKYYLGTDIYQKIKRVYIRTILEKQNSVQYFSQKSFKFEWVTGEVRQKNYFQQQFKQNAKLKISSSSSPSPSEVGSPLSKENFFSGLNKLKEAGGTIIDSGILPTNLNRNAISEIEDSDLYVNKKHYIRDRTHLEKFQVAVSSRKGNRDEDLPIQDDYLFYKDHLTTIFAVMDGHGPHGHIISNITYRLLLTKFLSSINCYVNPQIALKSLFRNLSKDIEKTLQMESMKYKLLLNQESNQFISGTSCTFIVKRFNTLIISHVGDTKAFVFKKNVNLNKKDRILAYQLTEDHTPSNTEERKRIYNCYGEVRLNLDFQERVYVRGRDYPGLHITRSIGDLIAAEIGVTSDPFVKTYEIDQNDNFLLVGTSSLFELIPIEEIWAIVSPFESKNVMEASRYLQARIKSIQKQQLQTINDNTFVLAYL